MTLSSRIMYFERIGYKVNIIFEGKYIDVKTLKMEQLKATEDHREDWYFIEKIRPTNMADGMHKTFYLRRNE